MSTHNRDPQVLAGVCGVVRGFHRSHTAWLWLHRRGPRDVEDRRPSAEQVPQVHLLLHHGHNPGFHRHRSRPGAPGADAKQTTIRYVRAANGGYLVFESDEELS